MAWEKLFKRCAFGQIWTTSTAVILRSWRGSISRFQSWRTLLQPVLESHLYIQRVVEALTSKPGMYNLQSYPRETWEVQITLQGGFCFEPCSFEVTFHLETRYLYFEWYNLIMIIDDGEHTYIILVIILWKLICPSFLARPNSKKILKIRTKIRNIYDDVIISQNPLPSASWRLRNMWTTPYIIKQNLISFEVNQYIYDKSCKHPKQVSVKIHIGARKYTKLI